MADVSSDKALQEHMQVLNTLKHVALVLSLTALWNVFSWLWEFKSYVWVKDPKITQSNSSYTSELKVYYFGISEYTFKSISIQLLKRNNAINKFKNKIQRCIDWKQNPMLEVKKIKIRIIYLQINIPWTVLQPASANPTLHLGHYWWNKDMTEM